MDRRIILLCAIPLGLAGGYAWSALTAPAVHRPPPGKATTIAAPPSPEERPAMLDKAWTSRADDSAAMTAAADQPISYSGCNAVRAAGKAPLYSSQPGYRDDMDGDGDGVACEPVRSH
jgi:hypothetical protein